MTAEEVPGEPRIEAVLGECRAATQQPEIRRRHDQVQEAGGAAQRAVAVDELGIGRRLDFEAHRATMAAATVDRRRPGLRHGARLSVTHGDRPAAFRQR